MSRVIWAPQAIEDVEAIRTYVARDSAHYADLVVERIVATAARLESHPRSGRVVPELGDELRDEPDGGFALLRRRWLSRALYGKSVRAYYCECIGMRLIFRLMALLLVVPATYYFIYWVPFSLLPFIEQRWIPSIISLLCAAGVGWYVWKKLCYAQAKLISSTLLGAVVLGAIGFCAGFFGPILLTPAANQGPLLGIFITGPLGFLLGGVGGFAYWLVKGRKIGQN